MTTLEREGIKTWRHKVGHEDVAINAGGQGRVFEEMPDEG